jgi:PAS domain S-box-containing protein
MADDVPRTEREQLTFQLLQALVQRAPVGIAFLDTEFRYVLVNDTLADINGRPPAEHVGRYVREIIPHLWPRFHPIYQQVLREQRPVTGIEVTRTAVGDPSAEPRTWLTSYYPVTGPAGDVIGIGVIASDVTDRKRAERELLRISEHQSAIVEAFPDLIFELSADSTHVGFHAPPSERLFVNPEQFIGKRVREVLPEDVARSYERAIERTLATGEMQVFEYALTFPDRGIHTYDARMVKQSDDVVLVVVRDVTERRRLEEQFRHAQKMEAIGRLAGGVAHDFNNLLTVINGCTAMVLERTENAESKEMLTEVSKAGQRAATLTRQLLLFSRQQVLEPRVLDLNDIVTETDRMLRRLIGEDVQLETRLAPDLRLVNIDRGQVEQVLVNLIVNARDAMQAGGGQIIITTENATVTDGESVDGSEMRPGAYVKVVVRDTGVGMDENTRTRIFEPFFTTKEPGTGTGLGLAVVFGAVKESGGSIGVHSEQGRGTTVELYFPALGAAVAEQSAGARPSALPRGKETILLVEDDPSVRDLVAQVLRTLGYSLLLAGDGREALTIVNSHPGRIDMLLSDVAIPHLSGRRLAEQVQRMRPGIRVLFMSGYTNDEVLRRGVLTAHMAFLQKPFTPQALAARVRSELDSGG